jgi:hypothetical protein
MTCPAPPAGAPPGPPARAPAAARAALPLPFGDLVRQHIPPVLGDLHLAGQVLAFLVELHVGGGHLGDRLLQPRQFRAQAMGRRVGGLLRHRTSGRVALWNPDSAA